jgi:hypothetical protein
MERHDIGCFLANVAGSLRRLTRAINPRFGMHFCVLASQPGHALFDEDQTDTPALSASAEWSKCKLPAVASRRSSALAELHF